MSNAKGRLQELLQYKGRPLPTYATGGVAGRWVCDVKVEWEAGEILRETAEAPGKKKDVEKLAAEKMLRLLLGRKKTPTRTSPASLSASARAPSLSPPVSATSRLSVPAETPTRPLMVNSKLTSHLSPSPPASCTRSPVSLLQERLQRLGLAPPCYSEEVTSASYATAFKCRCVVLNSSGIAVLAAEGEGSSKHRAKERSAEMMLKKVEECCSNRTFETLSPLSPQDPTHPEVFDGDLDSDITLHLLPYDPQFLSMQERGCHFCLAWSSLPSSFSSSSVLPIASHGSGETASAAKRQASCNLLANIHTLAYS